MFEIFIYRYDAIGFCLAYFFTKILICSILEKKESDFKNLLSGCFLQIWEFSWVKDTHQWLRVCMCSLWINPPKAQIILG